MTDARSKVLIVDDSAVDCALVAALLRDKFTVLEAPDAARGFELYVLERPDCVLLDHNLPGTSGVDALAEFVGAGAAVVMLTGDGSDTLAAEAFKRGARDFVLKNHLNRSMLERILLREIERRRLELELHDAQAGLRVAQRLEAIGQLAAGVAHEINTPAQYVDGNITFLAERFARLMPLLGALKERIAACPDDAARLRQLAEEANLEFLLREIPSALEEAALGMGHIKKIVTAMKEFSHPSDDKQAADLNHGIANTVTIARNEWKYVADVELELAPDLPHVACFPSEINQVVLNLLVNAAHAVGDVFDGENGKGKITIRTRRDGTDVLIEVEDNGCGIPEANLQRIWDPFFTTKEVGKGTGQGLALAHRIVVDHHGGAIRVTSQVGKGTRFKVRLPIEPADAAAPDQASAPGSCLAAG
ncbi:MAG TPA: ATP-binding protein [Gammaproteobacteria bacterium]|nr:ATP-binding protein [Gammaproteobacteria bacterium]